MPVVTVSPLILPMIQPAAYARNGMVVPTVAVQAAARGANQVMRWRTKELLSTDGLVESLHTALGGTVVRYRGFAHTGPHCTQLRYFVTVARCATTDTGDPYVTVAATTTGGGALDSSDIHIGQLGGSPSDVPDEWHEYTGTLDVTADTYILLTVSTTDHARVVHVLVQEQPTKADALASNLADGYQNGSPILDADRAAMQSALYEKWRRGAAHVMSWHATTARTTTSATATNVIDNTSTTVTTATPGLTLDMRYKARLGLASTTGVTCCIAAYGSIAAGANGQLLMKDSGGTTLATVGLFSTTPAWISLPVVLPATLAKYDFQFKTAASTFTLNDISIFEYET